MTPLRVRFTGLEFDPGTVLRERCSKGVIAPEWQRYRFVIRPDATNPVSTLNRWLNENIEGCWAIYNGFTGSERQITIAFEHDFDAVTFMMADGKAAAFTSS